MKPVSIIIPYIMGPDNGLELKYALRSIEKNFAHDNYTIVVVGDNPDWLSDNVNHVPMPRLQGGKYTAFKDQILKLYTVLTEFDVTDNFIWTYDDVYFTNKVTIGDIMIPKAAKVIQKIEEIDLYPGGDNWKNCIKKALKATNGKYVYETHLPRYYNKNKMLKLMDKFGMLNEPFVIASLYYNHYLKDDPLLLNDGRIHFRFMIRSTFDVEKLEKFMRIAKFSNNNPASYNMILKDVLAKIFPLRSRFEAGR